MSNDSAAGRMCECDEGVRFAAAVLRIEPEDGARLSTSTGEAAADVVEQALQARGRVGVGKKCRGVLILGRRIASEHLGEIGGELGFTDAAGFDVVSRDAEIKQRAYAGRFGHGLAPIVSLQTGPPPVRLSLWAVDDG